MDTWKHLSKQNEGALDSYAIYLLNPDHGARLQSDQLLRLKNANDRIKKKKLFASLSSFRLFLSGSFCITEGARGLESSSARLVAAASGPGGGLAAVGRGHHRPDGEERRPPNPDLLTYRAERR